MQLLQGGATNFYILLYNPHHITICTAQLILSRFGRVTSLLRDYSPFGQINLAVQKTWRRAWAEALHAHISRELLAGPSGNSRKYREESYMYHHQLWNSIATKLLRIFTELMTGTSLCRLPLVYVRRSIYKSHHIFSQKRGVGRST